MSIDVTKEGLKDEMVRRVVCLELAISAMQLRFTAAREDADGVITTADMFLAWMTAEEGKQPG